MIFWNIYTFLYSLANLVLAFLFYCVLIFAVLTNWEWLKVKIEKIIGRWTDETQT